MRNPLCTLVPVAFSLTLVTTACAESEATSASQPPPGIQVVGECLKKVAQDRGSVVVSTSIAAATPQEASEQTTQSHEKVRTQVMGLRLKDAASETINYSVMQECTYDQGKRHCQGYRAVYSTRFETSEIARLGEVISVAAKHPMQEVSQLETFVSPTKLKSERESCLEVATRDALSKAQTLARGANVTLGPLRFLAEVNDMGMRPPVLGRSTMALAQSEAAISVPAVEAKPVDLRVTVSATYDIN